MNHMSGKWLGIGPLRNRLNQKAPPKAEVQKSRELAGISAHTMDLGELTKVAAEIPAGEYQH